MKNKLTFAFFSLAVIAPGAALAQTAVPAISTTSLPPPVPLINQSPIPLSPKAAEALRIAHQWKARPMMPVEGDNGRVVFQYGATMPTLVCAPLHVCDISLQPGEVVKNINVGNKVQFLITPALSGSGADLTTHILVKPTNAGLSTDLIVTTTRRTYTIDLVSDRRQWTPEISFTYPEDTALSWQSYYQTVGQAGATSSVVGTNPLDLDFSYRITGTHPVWRPVRVYTNGVKTFIDFPQRMLVMSAPALLALGVNDHKELVNYRVKGTVYEVDKVLTSAELISGVGGNQQTVKITYTGKKY